MELSPYQTKIVTDALLTASRDLFTKATEGDQDDREYHSERMNETIELRNQLLNN